MKIDAKDIYNISQYLRSQSMSDWAQEIDKLYQRWESAMNRVEELEREITKLRLKDKYVFDEDSGYWKVDIDGKRIDGPFCPACFDARGRLCRLHLTMWTQRQCLVCHIFYPQTITSGMLPKKN